MRDYKPGDFYFRGDKIVGAVLIVTTINGEFAKYKAIQYVPSSLGFEHCDIYRLSEGPDELIGHAKFTSDREIEWEVAQNWDLPPNTTYKECGKLLEKGNKKDGMSFIIGGYVRASERKLEEHFNQVFA